MAFLIQDGRCEVINWCLNSTGSKNEKKKKGQVSFTSEEGEMNGWKTLNKIVAGLIKKSIN